jgi:hypothetical protein
MEIKAGFIPFLDDEAIHYERFPVGDGEDTLFVPALTTEQLQFVAEQVRKNARAVLKKYTVTEIMKVIDQAVHVMLDRTSDFRKQAEIWLPKITGYDAEMIRLSLTTYLKTFRKKELQKFLTEDFGNWAVLDDFQPRTKGGFSKAVAPDLVTHIWAGNVPGIPIWSFISSLLVKAGSIGKVSSGEPLFAGLFARAIEEVDPNLASCFAIVWWKGGDEEKERLIGELSEVVIGYGHNESLQSIRTRLPITTRFIVYGSKISFGIISRNSLQADKAVQVAKDAAYDVMRFDQQGCYSPQVFFVQRGGRTTPEDVSKMIAGELAQLEVRYPRQRLSMEESTAFSQWKQAEELKTFSDDAHEIHSDDKGSWTVVYGENEGVLATPLNRSIKIIPFDEINDVKEKLELIKHYLQTVGLACTPEELFEWAETLAEVGVTRLSSLGKMTLPEPGWHHDGRFNLLELVNFVDIDASAEMYSEQFAPYKD